LVFGSSIVRHVNGGKISRSSKTSTKVYSYPGATIEEIDEHCEIRLRYAKNLPTTIIIHGGGNNLANGDTVSDIVTFYEQFILKIKAKGIQNIVISGLTGRDNLKSEIPELNKSLRQLANKHDLSFISNSFITFKYHLCWDKVHLNFDGVDQMERNFSRYLRPWGGGGKHFF